jgi:hypothetical protein
MVKNQHKNKLVNYKDVISVGALIFSLQAFGEYQFSFESYNLSESFRIQELINDEPSSVNDGGVIYSQTRFTAGYEFSMNEQSDFSLAYLYRRDAQVKHSQGAADIYYLIANESEAGNESFKVDLDIAAFDAEGISLGYRFNPDLKTGIFHVNRLGFTLDIAESNNLFYGTLRSDVDYLNDNISGNADLDYYYGIDPVYNRDVRPAKGIFYGLNVDLAFTTENTRHTANIRDIYNLAIWKDAPHTRSQINTQRITGSRDDVTLEIRSLGSGREDFKTLYLRLEPRVFTSHTLYIDGHPNYLLDFNRMFDRTQVKVGAFISFVDIFLSGNNSADEGIGFKYSFTDNSGELAVIYGVVEPRCRSRGWPGSRCSPPTPASR